jgi:signal transduction histidine kinase/ligand-binding sensor domain-containing protein
VVPGSSVTLPSWHNAVSFWRNHMRLAKKISASRPITLSFCIRPRLGVLLLVALGLAIPANALDPQKLMTQFGHTAWSAADGLSGPIRAIAQTPDGYLWLGTQAGLYRFDGVRFVAWEPSFGEHLPGASVGALCVARDGSLWIGFRSGAVSRLFDGHLTTYSAKDGLPPGGIASVAEDNDGSVWVGGPYTFGRIVGGSWHTVGKDMGYVAPGAQAIFVDSRGTLWVSTDGFYFGLSGNAIERNTILSLKPKATRFEGTGEAAGQARTIAESHDGNIWITWGRENVRQITGQNGAKRKLGTDVISFSMLFDRDGTPWIGTLAGGLRRFQGFADPANSRADRFLPADGLSGNTIYSAFEDRERNLWFGTDSGLDRFRESKATPFSSEEGMNSTHTVGLAAATDQSLWLAPFTTDTVQRYHGGAFTTLRLPPYKPYGGARILAVAAGRNGQVWVGGNFKVAEEQGGRFSYVEAPEIEDNASVHAMGEDSTSNLWVTVWGGDKGGGVLRLKDGHWTDFRGQSILPNYRSRVLLGDPVGRVWFGFEDGEVAVYDGNAFHTYSAKDGLPGGAVLTITADRNGRIWVGAENGLGLFENGRFRTINKANGLPASSVSGVLQDDGGSFWLVGPLGVLRVSPRDLEKALASSSYRLSGTLLDASDGLLGLPLQSPPFPNATETPDGRLWISTTKGIAAIKAGHLPTNSVPPPVVIEAIKADRQPVEISAGMRLRPNTRDLEFVYTALSLTIPEHVRFRYKLEGYDNDWRGPVAARTISYTNLPPRGYRFRVIACNNDGVWNEQGAELAFSIAPAFYQTHWFEFLCILAAVSLAWTVYRWRIHQVTDRLDLQFRERLAERTRIAQELHDTLLQGFISASMQLSVANDQLPADWPAKPLVNRTVQLVRRVIEEGRAAVQGMRLSSQGAENLEQAFSRVPRELAVEAAASFRIVVEGRARPLHPLVRDDVYRIGREALVNALRHSQAAAIEVELNYTDRRLTVAVRDDGSGIDPAVLREGRAGHWGLLGMRERAERIGAQFAIRSQLGGGTEVEVLVPGEIAFRPDSPVRGR